MNNGHGGIRSGTPYQIDKLIEHHRRILTALEITRDLIHGTAREKKQKGENPALTAALAAERNGVPSDDVPKRYVRGPCKKAKDPRAYKSKVAERRQHSAAYLAHFDRHTPRPAPPINGSNQSDRSPLAALMRHGYLKRKGDGYVRTGKELSVTKPEPYGTERQRRQRTADYLAQYDLDTPKKIKSLLIPSLLKTGYIVHKGDGYVRTDKEFVVVRTARP